MRALHRWTALVFTLIVAALFAVQGMGTTPVEWVFYLPLAPLAVLFLSGAWMWVQHYRRH
jgi:K+ transporter